jgi:hypothetical protein
MKIILTTTVTAIVFFLGLQTYESARFHEISVTCEATRVDDAACVSLGPLGRVNPAALRFWVSSFIDHGTDLPHTLRDALG